MKIGAFLFLLLWTSTLVLAQDTWLNSLGGNSDDEARKIVTDKQANLYGVGYFQDTLNNLISYGSHDLVVFKYTPDGTLRWTTQLGSTQSDFGNDIAIDNNGNLYIIGNYKATLYFGNDSLANQGNSDVFVAKLDSSGIIQWIKGIGQGKYEFGNAIICDGGGNNIYVGGTFQDSLSIDNQVLQSHGLSNNFIAKLDNMGSLIWHSTLSTPTFNNIQDLKLDDNGDLYVIGYFRDFLDGALGQLVAIGNHDILLAKWSSSGQLLWWKKMGGLLTDYAFALHIATPYLYITGVFQDTAYFDNIMQVSEGEYDAFLAQLDMQGVVNWVQQIGGADDSKAIDLATMDNGHIYLVGYFEGRAHWDTDTVTSRDPRHVPSDVFIAEYASDGSYLSVQTIQGLLSDFATGISIMDSIIYVSGAFQDSLVYDSLGIMSHTSSYDMFILKYSKTNWTTVSNLPPLVPLHAEVFPNPMEQFAWVEFELPTPTKVDVLLYNSLGQLVQLVSSSYHNIGQQQIRLNKKELASGLYHIIIQTATQKTRLPLIIR